LLRSSPAISPCRTARGTLGGTAGAGLQPSIAL
jgi:hypothetical protein